MTARAFLSVVPAIVVMGFAAACGDDDDDGDALSKSEYVARGNAICAKGTAELRQKAEGLGESPSAAEAEKFTEDEVLPNVEGQIEDLRELPAPEGDEDELNAIYDDAEKIVDEGKEDPGSFGQGGQFDDVNRRLREYGLTVCGET